MRKRIIIAFRGSATVNDWIINLSAQLTNMRTPKLVGIKKKKLNDGEKSHDHVQIHRGFYGKEYMKNLISVDFSVT